MSVPEPYVRLNAYTDWDTNHPGEPAPGQDFDEDFDDLSRFSTELLGRLALIQREDGKLQNGIIDSEELFDDEFLEQLKSDIAAGAFLGIQGPQGPQGVAGPAGQQGPQGPPLAWIVSTGVPSTNIGVHQQLFLNMSNGDVYQKANTSWLLIGNIRGPQGTGPGISDHGMLTGIADPDHPISAIQGLQSALDDLALGIVAMGSAQKNVYRQPEPPTANLNAGDLWFDSNANDRLFRWDGQTWVDVADKRIETALVNAANAITQAAGAQATADGKVTTFFGSSNPVNPRIGDLWFRSDQQNAMYRHNGTQWVSVVDQTIAEAILLAADAQATADGKIETFYQNDAPVGASLGDLWFDTNDSNHPYRYNGAQWVTIRDAAIAQAAAQAAAAINAANDALSQVDAIADGVVEVFYAGTQPSSANVGDLWINTSLGNQLHRYNGTQWVSVRDSSIQTALTNAALAQSTADGKIRAFYQTSPPSSGMSTGDLWYDTDDQFRPYRYNGSAWQDVSYIVGVQGGLVTGVSIANGTITANKMNVSALSAITANIGTVTAGLLRNASGNAVFDLDNARIIFNNGSVMKVTGLAFGTSNQFVEWFGPSLGSISSCTESNAIFYLKTNGQAYFGGALSAGTLFNSRRTSDTASNASITLGPFGSNGGTITVAISYFAGHGSEYMAGQVFGSGESNSGTLNVYRSIGGGGETLVASIPLSGSCTHGSFDPGNNRTPVSTTMSGSLTFTDTAGTTSSRTYRATLASRSMNHVVTAAFRQEITITATE